jgi:hypothetical protein
MKAARQGCAVHLRAYTATNRDEKDPGMRVSQAMTRDAYIVSKSVDIRVRHLPVVQSCQALVGILSIGNVATLASHGALAKH